MATFGSSDAGIYPRSVAGAVRKRANEAGMVAGGVAECGVMILNIVTMECWTLFS